MSAYRCSDTPRHSRLLAPLAARYAGWLGLPAAATADTSDEDPAVVRAMPLVLRLERDEPPPRSALLEAAASAAVGVCLDERSEPGGPWHDEVAPWLAGRIRKVARRARGTQWHATGELPGVTVTHRGAQVRALLPWRVAQLPKSVSRLQVGGTDLPADDPGPPPPGRPVLWLAPDVALTAGKAAAQAGHATMILAALLAADRPAALAGWAQEGYRCAVRVAGAARWSVLAPGAEPERAWRERGVVAVRDAGFTEVAPGTVTCLAQLPPPVPSR
ncbi:MAG: peptidyl-tRNA hydrolase [Pseudonocardiaceae bacterium]